MKVKLLKKLRKKAAKRIYVVYDKSTYRPYIIYEKQPFKDPYFLGSYLIYKTAIEYCDSKRRIYIKELLTKILKRKSKRVY